MIMKILKRKKIKVKKTKINLKLLKKKKTWIIKNKIIKLIMLNAFHLILRLISLKKLRKKIE